MFAIVKSGGKQHRVRIGDELVVEKLTALPGDVIKMTDVLMLSGNERQPLLVGQPVVDGAAVEANVLAHLRGPKLVHFVRRRRKHGSQRTKGHRQELTRIRVTKIKAPDTGPGHDERADDGA